MRAEHSTEKAICTPYSDVKPSHVMELMIRLYKRVQNRTPRARALLTIGEFFSFDIYLQNLFYNGLLLNFFDYELSCESLNSDILTS